jgi:hypothetical protein
MIVQVPKNHMKIFLKKPLIYSAFKYKNCRKSYKNDFRRYLNKISGCTCIWSTSVSSYNFLTIWFLLSLKL